VSSNTYAFSKSLVSDFSVLENLGGKKMGVSTFRISSVPNKDLKMLESIALTVPIVRLPLLENAILVFGTETKARRNVQRNTIFSSPQTSQSPASPQNQQITPQFQPKSDARNDGTFDVYQFGGIRQFLGGRE
jgi:hypothetical protein